MEKSFLLKVLGSLGFLCASLAAPAFAAGTVNVSFGGNAFVTKGNDGRDVGILPDGIVFWQNTGAVVSVFFAVSEPQKDVRLSLRGRGRGKFEISVPASKTQKAQKFIVSFNGTSTEEVVPVGKVSFDSAGYQRIDIRRLAGRRRLGAIQLSSVVLDDVNGNVVHSGNFNTYFARRGPSVHMSYVLPEGRDFKYFYNEISVPPDADSLGSYYMACGFAEGYFGIQVNSDVERRVLFSVWSPYGGHDPNAVPERYRVRTVRAGNDVHVGEFGNEGVGAQSFLRYPWRAGKTYRFLLRVQPQDDGSTSFAGYFYAPEENRWLLIAEFARPETHNWLRAPHSFLENFYPQFGWRERFVELGNVWACDTEGNWTELTRAKFTCDDTGNAGARQDFAGGITRDNKSFWLRQCGFFSEKTEPDSFFEREGGRTPPQIDFASLEKLGSTPEA